MKIIHTLKFKLAFWYSIMLMLFALFFVFVFNVIAARYIELDPMMPRGGMFRANPIVREITERERELIKQSRINDLNSIRSASIYSIIPLVLLSFLGGYLIAQRNLKPLDRLKEEMEMRDSTDLESKIPFEDNNDEISSLISSFNKMSGRLHNSFEIQKEFVENVSHEIKTPLAILNVNIDSAMEEDVTTGDIKEILNNCKKSVSYINKLSEDLLLLSFLDQSLKKEKIDISKIIKLTMLDIERVASGFSFNFENRADGKAVFVFGNEILLRRAISNILENGVKYSKGSSVDIELFCNERNIEIFIEDDGVGIPKKLREKVFSRFYRVDKSRSRETGGSGLGLSIASEIISKHQGTIEIVDSKKGARFKIVFPKFPN